jgi:hypothetical protein
MLKKKKERNEFTYILALTNSVINKVKKTSNEFRPLNDNLIGFGRLLQIYALEFESLRVVIEPIHYKHLQNRSLDRLKKLFNALKLTLLE